MIYERNYARSSVTKLSHLCNKGPCPKSPSRKTDDFPFETKNIGCAFLATSFALIWAAWSPHYRLPLVGVTALFLATHAILHAYDTLRGALGHNHWLLDLPGVYLPGLVMPAIALWLARMAPTSARTSKRVE